MGIVKGLVDIAKEATIAATKGIKTLKGKRAAERALRHLLAGGSETDATFLRDVKIIKAAETGGRPAELVNMVAGRGAKKAAARKPAAKKVAAKRPAAKKAAAKRPAAKKVVAKKPAAKKVVAKKPAAKKVVAKKPAARKFVA